MQRRLCFLAAALAAIALAVYAQSAAVGTWKGEIALANASRAVTLVINADGTGTFNAGSDNSLSGIVIEGDAVSFSLKPVAAGGAIAMSMVGKVDGDTLTLVGTVGEGNPGPPLVLSRQK
jgi:hypothetical protein